MFNDRIVLMRAANITRLMTDSTIKTTVLCIVYISVARLSGQFLPSDHSPRYSKQPV